MSALPPTDPKVVLDALPVSVARMDTQFCVHFANRHFCRQLGRPPEQVVGRTCRELGMSEDVFGRWEAAMADCLRTGEPGSYEYVCRYPNGEERLVEYRFAPEPAGTVLVVAITLEEVPRLRRALSAHEELFRTFMDCSPVIAWMRDATGRYVYLNRTYLDRYNLEPADRLGKTAADVWPADVAARFAENDRQVLAAGRPVTFYEQAPDSNGDVATWMNVKFPFRGLDGGEYLGGVGVDMTARQRAEDAARALEQKVAQAQRLESLGLLAAGAAHDFSNIVSVLRGYADMATAAVAPGSPAAEHLRHIADASDRAAELCGAMLAFAGKSTTVPRPLDLARIAAETARLARPLLPPDVALRFDFAEATPAVVADAAQLRQVVLNLITNAAEACTGGTGTITLATAVNGGAVLRVSDDGCGMPADVAAHIFEPFFTTKPQGRGLGLAAVDGIVRSCGGTITVASEPGRGTTFTVTFPAPA
jgi:two-component system, cell cycle sensor histidine kinase and response regulator CckA